MLKSIDTNLFGLEMMRLTCTTVDGALSELGLDVCLQW